MTGRGRWALLSVAALAGACDGPLVEGRLYRDSADGAAAAALDGAARDAAAGLDGARPTGDGGGRVDGAPPGGCGDGVVGPGETCDPPGSCPASCDDGVACTRDVRSGDAATCDVTCEAVPIEACADGDGCCPAGCNSTNDGDCSESCGNGVVEAGETCDPPGSCPASCDDGVACTTDVTSGSAASCSLACSHTAITACTSGDGCCPSGCNATNDGDCSPTCGNGVIERGETCDPPSSCPTSCADGMACTTDSRTGASSSCNVRCSHTAITTCTGGDGCCPSGCNASTDADCAPVCGDGACGAGETCVSCAADCGACTCGDGLCTASAGELCTSCGADCNTRSSVCGNGECQSGETSASCRADCGPAPWPPDWGTWETEVVALFNMHRAAGTDCPSGAKAAVGPVAMEGPLQTASRLHSWDQSHSGYFSHTSCNGRTFSQRASAQGTSAYGEIIARGQTSPSSAVSSWMASTAGHCDIIMNGSYTRVGVGYAQASGGARLWTGMFR